MTSNQEIFANFMSKVNLVDSEYGFDLLIPHKGFIGNSTEINIKNGKTGCCLDFSNLNKKTIIEFLSFDTPDLYVRCNLCNIFPS